MSGNFSYIEEIIFIIQVISILFFWLEGFYIYSKSQGKRKSKNYKRVV